MALIRLTNCISSPVKSLVFVLLTYEIIHMILTYNVILDTIKDTHIYNNTFGYRREWTIINSSLGEDVYLQTRLNVTKSNITSFTRPNRTIINLQNRTIVSNPELPSTLKKRRHRGDPHATSYARYKSLLREICRTEDVRHQDEDTDTLQLCPCFPPGLRGRIIPNVTSLPWLTWPAARSLAANTTSGGHWRPAHCAPRRRVAVIIPCRDRERHLRAFLAHTHAILQRQLLEYRVFVVEQEMPYTFNKGAMMNIGYLEAARDFRPHCLLIHDVDLLMENDRHLVACGRNVQHMGAYIEKFKYHLKYTSLVGGAVLLSAENFRRLNGYSNKFWGWGGEDDDFNRRIRWQNMSMFRAPRDIATYSNIQHKHDLANPRAGDRGKYRRMTWHTYQTDGANSVRYHVIMRKEYPLYTWIHAQLLKTRYSARYFNTKKTTLNVLRARCLDRAQAAHNTTFTLSAVTCRQLCMERHQGQCVGILYYHSDITDSYCQLLHTMCNRTEPNRTEEIHIKHAL